MSYARAVLYDLSADYDEVIGTVREGPAPLFKEQPGFEGYRTVNGGDKVVSVSFWDSQEHAESATERAAEWVRDNLAGKISARETIVGEVTELG